MALSARITLVTFASVTVAVVLVSVISVVGVYGSVLGEEATRLRSFRALVASSLDARFDSAERSVDLLASSVGTTTAEAAPGIEMLDVLLDTRADVFDALVSIGPSGEVSSVEGAGIAAPVEVIDAARAASEAPLLKWEQAAPPGTGRLWAVRSVVDGTATVTLLARVRTTYLGRTLDDVARSAGSVAALVVDGSGRPVLWSDRNATIETSTISYSRAGTSAVEGIASAQSPAIGGLSGYWELIVPDHGLGWRVVVLEADADAIVRSRAALAPALVALLVVLVASVVATLLYSRRVLAPLRLFEQRARDVAAGGYVRPMRIVRDDEMGRVAEAFNDMGVRLNSLQDMVQLLATASDLNDVMDAVLNAISRILGTGDCAVLLADSSGLALSLVRGRGLRAPSETLLVPLDESSPLSDAFRGQKTIPFIGEDPAGAAGIYRLFGADPGRAGVIVPLAAGAEVIGVVVVLAPGHRVFTDAQIETLGVFSANAAVAVRTSRLFAEERLSRREAEALRAVADLTVHPGDLGRAMDGSAAIAAQLLGYGEWGVVVEGRVQLGLGVPADPDVDARLIAVWRSVERGRFEGEGAPDAPVVVEDVWAHPDIASVMGPAWGSALFLPLLQGSVARGALVLHDRARMHVPTSRQLSVGATIGRQVSLAMRSANLLEQARTRAMNLETLFRISQAVSSELQVGAVLNRVLDVVQKILFADAVALMSFDPERRVIETSMARGITTSEMLYFSVEPGIDIPGEVFSLGTPSVYGELSKRSTPLAKIASKEAFESLLAVPLMARGRPIGVLAVYSKATSAFSGQDVELLMTFAAQAALAIDTAAMYGKEHRVASVLQASILPDVLPVVPGLEAASFYLPCGPEAEIGGDFYDLYLNEGGCVVLAIGDVCGKGVTAATKTSTVKYTLRGLIGAGVGPGDALTELNRQVSLTGDPSDIVTMWIGVLDLETGALTYADGGHPPALLMRSATRRIERLGATGPLLGAVEGARYEERSVELQAEDTLLLYTDGVTEARRGIRLFGEGRIRRVLRSCGTAQACLDSLLEAVKAHTVGPLRDDAAALAVRFLAAGSPETSVGSAREG